MSVIKYVIRRHSLVLNVLKNYCFRPDSLKRTVLLPNRTKKNYLQRFRQTVEAQIDELDFGHVPEYPEDLVPLAELVLSKIEFLDVTTLALELLVVRARALDVAVLEHQECRHGVSGRLLGYEYADGEGRGAARRPGQTRRRRSYGRRGRLRLLVGQAGSCVAVLELEGFQQRRHGGREALSYRSVHSGIMKNNWLVFFFSQTRLLSRYKNT